MMQMMTTMAGGTSAANSAQRHAWVARRAVGFAIFASGVAVIVAQALQHALGG
ncbi:hypothetical protein B0G81_5740 [Paraburkholderia sp. BL6665CI2N2]|uniref:hypothetical protein n=1 Tax=Paraburkholderia sp. BL6665CI2N2 TaxID=1938806 RepID=UPI0010F41606|nr:hypothetical protein [Paraburkholderia sp. BL6665CI2N2]TDY25282.1 hypothetical protein B0G81_5740 [Paraburkholderia sp. BL6665CI2N2]